MDSSDNLKKSLFMTFLMSSSAVLSVAYIQITSEKGIVKCSYLDPITIDILAFVAALFLVVEGIYKIFLNRDDPVKKQFLRGIRITFGFCILTLHFIQFLHK